VIPHAFTERAVLKLMLAALLRAAERWRGIRMTEFEVRQLQGDPRRTRKRSRRTNSAGREPKRHRTPGPSYPERTELDLGAAEMYPRQVRGVFIFLGICTIEDRKL